MQNYIEITNEMKKEDREFLVDVIFKIKDYAVAHNMEPDDAIRSVAENMLSLLKIATFNGGDRQICD